jgi:alcohol dehydrogenase (cytochrome c)
MDTSSGNTRGRKLRPATAARSGRKLGPAVALVLLMAAVAAAYPAAQDIGAKDLLDGLANPSRWLMYSGDYSSKRHSPLTQITPANVNQLAAQWTFQTSVVTSPNAITKFEATPVVIDGIFYFTGINNYAWAIDGRTGKQIWRYQRALPQGMKVCCGPVNRGFAVYRDRLFMTTLDAHVIALDAKTGRVIWDVPMIEFNLGYSGTVAPLVVKDKLIVGVAGGEFAARGFIDAYDPQDGKRLWRFWTIPEPGEPGGDTWPPGHYERGGGGTWLTGSYDPELNLLYWGTGNPNPDFYGEIRKGDNLYTDSVVALDPDTGRLRWHFQFTPHDEHDWDSNQIDILADLTINGRARKTLITANRNGFFYVLDRATGEFIQAKPYVKTTWATEVDAKGRPIELPNQRPTASGTRTCPDLAGGSSFTSTSFDPSLGLFFMSARETCQTYASAAPRANYQLGDSVMGGTSRERGGTGALRAIDPVTLERRWEVPYAGPSYSGVLSTASGLVFAADHDGTMMAVESRTGKVLWQYRFGAPLYGAATTFTIDGRQFVLVPAGSTVTAFALPAAAAR